MTSPSLTAPDNTPPRCVKCGGEIDPARRVRVVATGYEHIVCPGEVSDACRAYSLDGSSHCFTHKITWHGTDVPDSCRPVPSDKEPEPTDAFISREHPEGTCQRCHGPNVVWFAPNEVWNVASAHLTGDRGAILCPLCFIVLAERGNAHCGAWRLSPKVWTEPWAQDAIRGFTATRIAQLETQLSELQSAHSQALKDIEALTGQRAPTPEPAEAGE